LKASLKFRSAFKNKEVVVFNDVEIPFISYQDLLLDKQANARAKDIADIEELKNRKEQSE
jgi:hypothetical protein